MPIDIAEWLDGLGLSHYAKAFAENAIDWEVLPQLTGDDFKEIGVAAVGHRRKLLEAIAGLREVAPVATLTLPSSSATVAAPRAEVAERRQLTVMFCDLVGSTALAARLDPEDLREIIAAYHRAVAEIVAGFDGFVAKYMGDGVLAYFGYPRAHEDDAERAVRAGLGVIDAVARLDVKSVKLQARVGIATGLVVVGDLIGEGPAQEQSVVGETPNLAARLQALAEPDAVVIAAGTRRLVGDLFEYRDLGAVEVKGIAGPVPAWQVLRPSVVASRFEALRGSALTRLVGRDEEIDLLLRRWARAKAGDGQVVLISGEPGIGKSRLTAALEERLHAEPHFRLRYFCSPYHQDSALFPFIDQLGRAAGFARDDPPAARLEKLEAVLSARRAARRGFRAPCRSAVVAGLGAPQAAEPQSAEEEGADAGGADPAARWPGTPAAGRHGIRGRALDRPDLARAARPRGRAGSEPAGAADRDVSPEFQPPWTGQAQVSMLALNRLDRRDRTALVEQIAGGKALPDEVIDQIVERADGVPLFVEELTKSVLESGLLREEGDRYVLDGALPPLAIPTTLHDSLMARLDRLASVRVVAQTGAAIGREFSYALLHAVCRLPEDELQAALARLVASELVFQRGSAARRGLYLQARAGAGRGARQPAAQASAATARADRRSARNPIPRADGQPTRTLRAALCRGRTSREIGRMLGQGWSEVRRPLGDGGSGRAISKRAGPAGAAAGQPGTPATGARILQRLGCGVAKPQRVLPRRKWVMPIPAPESCGSNWVLPRSSFMFPIGQSRYHVFRGELDLALRLDEDLLRLSRQRNDSAGLVLGHTTSGLNLMSAGRFASSRSHLEEAIALCDPISHHSLVHQAGIHPYGSAHPHFGNRPVLSRFSGPGSGTEQRSNR